MTTLSEDRCVHTKTYHHKNWQQSEISDSV